MLDLGDQHHPPARLVEDVEEVVEAQDALEPVESGIRRPELRHPLLGTQSLEFTPQEVLGEPARDLEAVDRFRGPLVGEFGMLSHIGRHRDLVLVPDDEYAVFRGDEVGLHSVATELDRQ